MTLYEKFRQLDIDFSRLGLQMGDTDVRHFCTPRDAEIIGWAGVDGIHYCFIPGYGEMVFAVSPMNLPGEYVHPLAESFEDFLRLLLACNSLDVMEQAYRMDRETFGCEVWEASLQVQARQAIQEELALAPMPEPYDYIKKLQAGFDYSKIPYTEEYTDWGPEKEEEWKVCFEHGDRPGKEVPVHTEFTWDGNRWHIPAIYLCGAGLVIDFCAGIEPNQLKDNRLFSFHFGVQAVINGRTLRWTSGSGFHWVPLSALPEGERPSRTDTQAVRHYRLDPFKGWTIRRLSLPWATKRKPQLKSIRLHLEPDAEEFPGPRFTAPEAGGSFPFTHPVFGTEHTFTVLEYERGEMDPERFQDAEMVYPCHYTAMTYDISPDIPRNRLSVQDCDRGDSPRPKNPRPGEMSSSCGILFASSRGESRTAVSSLHFEPVEQVEWQMTFLEKTVDDVDIVINIEGDTQCIKN